MKLAIHPSCKGKPQQKHNLAEGWQTIECSLEDAFELITCDGYASTAALTSDHRNAENFESKQLFMVDIDQGMRIEDLLTNEFYNKWGAGFYASPSFTHAHHKFRILFQTKQPITDPQLARTISRGLCYVFDHADKACVDASRMFFGTINCELRELRGKVLAGSLIAELYSLVAAFDDEGCREGSQEVQRTFDSHEKRAICEKLRGMYVGEYTTWRNIGWGMRKGGFELADFQFVTQGLMRKKTAKDAERVWNAAKQDGKITMGTVVYLLKQHYGDDVLSGLSHTHKLNELMKETTSKLKRWENEERIKK
jgi:hypothetical protein